MWLLLPAALLALVQPHGTQAAMSELELQSAMHSAAQYTTSHRSMAKKSMARLRARDDPEPLAPKSFLFVSSPMEQKVCYVELVNLKPFSPQYAPALRVSPLIDSGLTTPMGICVDRSHGYLYVADLKAGSIFQYTFFVVEGSPVDSISSDGVQTAIIVGRAPRWCAVDKHGHLYWTDQASNGIYKIEYDIVEQIKEGVHKPEDLKLVSEQEEDELAEMKERQAIQKDTGGLPTTPPPLPPPVITTLYEASVNPMVSSPAGISTNGVDVFWVNEKGGTQAGSLIEGAVHPKAPAVTAEESEDPDAPAPAPEPSTKRIAANTNGAQAVAFTSDGILWTDTTMNIYGAKEGGPPVVLASNLQEPRGIVWDGDDTAYAADQKGNSIYMFPVSRLQAGIGASNVIGLHDAFGLAILSQNDAAWKGPPAPAAEPNPVVATFNNMMAPLYGWWGVHTGWITHELR